MARISQKDYWLCLLIYIVLIFVTTVLIIALIERIPQLGLMIADITIIPFAVIAFAFITYIIFGRVRDFSPHRETFLLFYLPSFLVYIPDFIASFKTIFSSNLYNEAFAARYINYKIEAFEQGIFGINYLYIITISLVLIFILGLIPPARATLK